MARRVRRLAARSVESLKKPGRHADGDGLYLVVDPSGARRWLFMFRWNGKLKEMAWDLFLGCRSQTPASLPALPGEGFRLAPTRATKGVLNLATPNTT